MVALVGEPRFPDNAGGEFGPESGVVVQSAQIIFIQYICYFNFIVFNKYNIE